MNIRELLSRIEEVTQFAPKKSGNGYLTRCPAHKDGSPSLSVSEAANGKVLVHCHAKCSFDSITAALGIKGADLLPKLTKPRQESEKPLKSKDKEQKTPCRETAAKPRETPAKIVAAYDYKDAAGKLVFQVCRMEPKSFRQRRPNGKAWTWNVKGITPLPYRLPEILAAAKAGKPIFIVEGEKDVAAMVQRGFEATCNAGGAGKWQKDWSDHFLAAKLVVIIADKDAPGRAHAIDVAKKLKDACKLIKVIELPDVNGQPVKDAADFWTAGGTIEAFNELVEKTPQYIAKDELTPNHWFKMRFPGLTERYGEPMNQRWRGGRTEVVECGVDFMAATLSDSAVPDAPTVYAPQEDRFWGYVPAAGVYVRHREEDLAARLSATFLACSRETGEAADVSPLAFRMRGSDTLSGIVRRAKSVLAVDGSYFAAVDNDLIPVANGMLRLSDRTLLPFAPGYRRRHKLAVKFDARAYCPRFLEELVRPALDPGDVFLMQRWGGLALVGVNLSQRMLILSGTPGGGKSTFVSVLSGIIGQENVGQLRPELLRDRFEIGRLLGKTLLYGPDVPDDFLSVGSASVLKSLTGGDQMTVELKNSNEAPQMECRFNVIVTSNSRLTVHLEGDADAWRRRLAVVTYEKPKPAVAIPNFAARIVGEEGSGVLNWLLDGLDALKASGWDLKLNEAQQRRVDDLLLESESHEVFARECIMRDGTGSLTVTDSFTAYTEFCFERGWNPIGRNQFGRWMPDAMVHAWQVGMRHDVQGSDGKNQRGWKGIRIRGGT